MDGRFNTLAQQLFQKPLEQITTEEIKRFTEQYPFFAPAHFLLLHKVSAETDEYNSLYQKALLFYHDPVQFASFLDAQQTNYDFNGLEVPPVILQNDQPEISPEPEPLPDPVEEKVPESKVEELEDEEPVALPLVEEPVKETPITLTPQKEPLQELTFEPFHTVDYFASQGIRLSQDEIPKDQLGKQLKSFTEWLRVMKRLPATELVKAVDSSSEKKVENLAQHSIQSADVVTESMAEVWLRQGATHKALDIYNKLSLQNPSKRAYFAAKIENLKKSL
jgi:hypothetical protein